MKCFVLTLRDDASVSRFNRLKNSLLQFGWRDADVVPVYGRRGADFHDLAAEYGVSVHPFYTDHPERKEEFNKAFSCTVGHVEIWKKIAYGHLGYAIVCEDDVVFKENPGLVARFSNTKINWLGPRVWSHDDYNVPYNDFRFVEVDRFEGTHAYAISEGCALRLYNQFKKQGFSDSLDAQMGMRGTFGVEHQLLDPPCALAVVGDQVSSITGEGAAFWNADNLPGFLEGLKPNAKIPPERKVIKFDTTWQSERASILAEIEPGDTTLFIGCSDGDNVREIANVSMGKTFVLEKFDDNHLQIVTNNVHLSQNYYEVGIINRSDWLNVLASTVVNKQVFDVVVINGASTAEDLVTKLALANLLVKFEGKLIIRGIDDSFEPIIERINATWLLKLPTVQVWKKS